MVEGRHDGQYRGSHHNGKNADAAADTEDKQRPVFRQTHRRRIQYKHGDTRADNQKGVRQTLARIRALINCNVVNPSFCRWLTFTYAENMTDTKRLYKDWDTFRKRFGRWCAQNGIDKPEYIAVVEPQGRGAWHLHVFSSGNILHHFWITTRL